MRRKLLGTASNLATRVRVYLAADAIEIDEIEGYSGIRKRVLFDEVLLVTRDRRRRIQSILLWLVVAFFFSMPAFFMFLSPTPLPSLAMLVTFAVLSGPFLLAALVHIALGVDHVTVFGKRTSAQIRFLFRKRRARQVFALLRDRVREAQQPAVVEAQPVPAPAPDAGGGTAAA